MEENNFSKNLKTVDIPKVFRTFVSEEYFSNCITCDRYLLDGDTEYVIEKVLKDSYAEVEYAMCMECVDKMRKKLSAESLQRVDEFFQARCDLFGKRYNMLVNHVTNVDDYISRCIVNEKSIHELDEYQIFAHCRGKKLVLSVFPYMISHDVVEEVQELLSAKTKEELDDFTNTHFGLPPELKEIIKNKKLVLI